METYTVTIVFCDMEVLCLEVFIAIWLIPRNTCYLDQMCNEHVRYFIIYYYYHYLPQ